MCCDQLCINVSVEFDMFDLRGFLQRESHEASELMNKSCNKCVDAEIDRRSRVLLAQHPRPSLISGHDRR